MQLIKMITLLGALLFSMTTYAEEFNGKITEIPPSLQNLMSTGTWRAGCPIPLTDLAYLQVSYWGFDDKPHQGEIIVHKKISDEVLNIFKQLFNAHFPIQQMILPEKLAGSKKFDKPSDLLMFTINANDTYSSMLLT